MTQGKFEVQLGPKIFIEGKNNKVEMCSEKIRFAAIVS